MLFSEHLWAGVAIEFAVYKDLIAQNEIVKAEKGPATELEVGTYALLWSFSYTNHRCTSYNPSAYMALSVPVMGGPLSSGCLAHIPPLLLLDSD